VRSGWAKRGTSATTFGERIATALTVLKIEKGKRGQNGNLNELVSKSRYEGKDRREEGQDRRDNCEISSLI